MKIRKIVSMLLILALLNGCSKSIPETESTISPIATVQTIEPTISPTILPATAPSFKDVGFGAISAQYSGGFSLCIIDESGENVFPGTSLVPPSYIDLFIGEEKNMINFIYERCFSMTDEQSEVMKTMDSDYYGELTEIADNVYQSKGDFQPIFDNYERKINDETDFYIVLQEEKLYFVFEEMDIEQLQDYESDYFATFEKIINED